MKTLPKKLFLQHALAVICLAVVLIAAGCEATSSGPLTVAEGKQVVSFDVTGMT